jgi:O-antigen ligase
MHSSTDHVTVPNPAGRRPAGSAPFAIAVTAVIVTASVGYTIGTVGPIVTTAVPAVIGVLALAMRPDIGLMILAASIPLEEATLLPGGASVARVIGLVVASGWILHKLTMREGFGRAMQPLSITAAIFIVYACISTTWGTYPVRTGQFVMLAQLFGMLVIIIDLSTTPDRLNGVIRALVLGSTIAAVLVVVDYILHPANRAGDGITGGVNATARLLVTAVPLGFFLITASRQARWRFAGILYVVMAAVAVLLTFSRSSFLLLALVIALFYPGLLRGRRALLWLAAPVLLGISLLRFVPVEDISDRVSTIGPYVSETLTREPGDLSSSRGFHLRVALAIFVDHPILGAGYRNYGPHFLEYQWRMAGGHKIWATPRSPHSSHLGVLADLGLVGVLIWSAMFVCVAMILRRTARAWRQHRRSPERLLVRAVIVCVVVQFLFGFTGEVHTEKVFWLALGLAVVVHQLYRNGPSATGAERAEGASANLHRRLVEVGA